METGSPVALAGDYTIPEEAVYISFFYKVLQADSDDSIDFFINDELVWSKTVEDDLGDDITLSDWINVAQWMGQTVRLTFRINSFDGLPLTMELHDMVFAQIGDLEKIWNHDGDADGMADMWEGIYLGDTSQDANGDFDNDGLKNSEEFNLGTSPNLTDSDNDGKDDYAEVQSGSNPLIEDSASQDADKDEEPEPEAPTASNLTASAGPDQTVKENAKVTLNATADNTTGTITLNWTQLSGPTVVLTSTSSSSPTFTAPEVGEDNISLTFQLTITDSTGAKATDTCTITIENTDTKSEEGPGEDDSSCFISTIFLM